MAKLVDIYRSEKDPVLKQRQLPLVVNENLTMIMDLNTRGLVCDNPEVKGRELDEFIRKYNILSPEEIKDSFEVTCDDLLFILGQTVPCVGCRRSVERLFYQLMESGHTTLDPLVITSVGILTIKQEMLAYPRILCTLLHGHSSRLQCLVDSQPRSKKSRRCVLHSLESNRSRIMSGTWRDVWECMRCQCREEVTFIKFQTLQDTLENYLRKHRFCGECRIKVIRAYQLLVEEVEPQKEKGYVGALYEGIRKCLPKRHLHLKADTDYITALIVRAEPELSGGHRERHAKTLEIAQEEVLICLGICLHERLHRISLRLREEEGTCQVLAAVAVDALHRKFETAVERKLGVTKLELLYEEIAKEEAAQQQRKEQKKLRKRKKKDRRSELNKGGDNEELGEADLCQCENCLEQEKALPAQTEPAAVNIEQCLQYEDSDGACHSCHSVQTLPVQTLTKRLGEGGWSSSEHSQDCGYSSENNNRCCDTASGSCSLPSSPEGSEVACSEGFCDHDREKGGCTGDTHKTDTIANYGFALSLEDMLLDSGASDEEHDNVSYIPIEDVMEFKSRHNITEKRQELRQTLKNRFARLCDNVPHHVSRATN